MTDTTPAGKAETQLLGRALARLRDARGRLTQEEVAHALGISKQAYQKWESGETELTAGRLARALQAIGASQAELELERARLLGRPPPAASRGQLRGFRDAPGVFEIPMHGAARAGDLGDPEIYDVGEPVATWALGDLLGPEPDSLEVVGESNSPRYEPGERVVFDRRRWPKPNKGCVIEMKNGQLLLKLYVRSNGPKLTVRQLNPAQTFDLDMSEVKGVYRVTMKSED